MATLRTLGFNAKPRNPENSVGKKFRTVNAQLNTTANVSPAAADVWLLAGPLTLDQRVARIMTMNASPTLSGATSTDLGFYGIDTAGNLKLVSTNSATAIWAAQSLVGPFSTRDLLNSIVPALDGTQNIGQMLALGNESEFPGGVYLGLRFNTAVTVTVKLDLDVYLEEATTA